MATAERHQLFLLPWGKALWWWLCTLIATWQKCKKRTKMFTKGYGSKLLLVPSRTLVGWGSPTTVSSKVPLQWMPLPDLWCFTVLNLSKTEGSKHLYGWKLQPSQEPRGKSTACNRLSKHNRTSRKPHSLNSSQTTALILAGTQCRAMQREASNVSSKKGWHQKYFMSQEDAARWHILSHKLPKLSKSHAAMLLPFQKLLTITTENFKPIIKSWYRTACNAT